MSLLDQTDQYHEVASAWFSASRVEGEPLMTHAYVVVEASALIQRRLGAGALRAFHQDLVPVVEVVDVDRATREAAVAALLAALPTKTSIVDFVSFQVMRDRGIRRAFAFDPDFLSAGFETVP